MTVERGDVAARVSRETLEHLDHYVDMLRKWTSKINLVSPSTLQTIWGRHIDDCLQLIDHAPKEFDHWVDLGTGAGLPGLVVAIALEEKGDRRITLIEADHRKCAFLTSVINSLGLGATVITERIEDVEPLSADVISARALAPLDSLLDFTRIHRKPTGVALFPKGQKADSELTSARKNWNVEFVRHASRTSPDACILEIGKFSRV